MEMALEGSLSGFLQQLSDGVQDRVVRSAVHAMALVYYEEARRLVPVYQGEEKFYVSGKPVVPGALRDAIYRAHSPEESVNGKEVYKVSWNAKKAPFGHLIENGHWRVNKVFYLDGKLVYTKERLSTPIWVPPHSFIRRAGDAAMRALRAGQQRAVERLNELLRDIAVNGPLIGNSSNDVFYRNVA